jgi:hypothetical protein
MVSLSDLVDGGLRGQWWPPLRDFLSVSLDDDGTLKSDVVDDITTGMATSTDLAAVQTDVDTNATNVAVLTSGLGTHLANLSNPHVVTKTQVGLGNVDNTSDANKPVSTATQTALDLKATAANLTSHTGNTSNPHSVTKSQVGLANADNTSDANKPVSSATQTALDAKVADFTQNLVVTLTFGDSINVLTSGEPVQDFVVPETCTLVGTEVWADASGSITFNSAKAASGSVSFTDIDASAPINLSSQQTKTPDTTLTGWTTAITQYDKIRTNVTGSPGTVKRVWVSYRFTKARA